jgi:hypothetical protein
MRQSLGERRKINNQLCGKSFYFDYAARARQPSRQSTLMHSFASLIDLLKSNENEPNKKRIYCDEK